MRVDLPEPLGPTRPTTPPAGTARSRWSTATRSPKRRVRPAVLMASSARIILLSDRPPAVLDPAAVWQRPRRRPSRPTAAGASAPRGDRSPRQGGGWGQGVPRWAHHGGWPAPGPALPIAGPHDARAAAAAHRPNYRIAATEPKPGGPVRLTREVRKVGGGTRSLARRQRMPSKPRCSLSGRSGMNRSAWGSALDRGSPQRAGGLPKHPWGW